ncbi:MAG: hypothetical protein QG650_619 [Patescibacteria group bacterium]|nr:hypothetical protein [Patescibacteria group bacterium]
MKALTKKLIAGVSVAALLVGSAHAATTFTGSVTGGTVDTDVVWDDTYNGTNNATGSSTVQVSAKVASILTMAVSTGAINFGTLSIGANAQSLTLATASNARNGITVAMGSIGLATGSAGTDKYIGTLGRASAAATTTGTDAYKVLSSTDAGGTVIGSATDIAGSQNVLIADNVAKANATTTVNLNANIDAQTEAGDYNDVLTFTVTGNF